jgi:hypothetical protein
MTRLNLRVWQRGRPARLRGIDIHSIEQFATISRVPGSHFGMALVRGQIIPVLRLGDSERCLIVGRVRSEVLGIVGLEILGFDFKQDPAEGGANSLGARSEAGDTITAFRWDPAESEANELSAPHEISADEADASRNGSADAEIEIDVAALFDAMTTELRSPSQTFEEFA